MSVTATTRYVIRTTSGDKGPFSPAEISRLVENGRLPPTAKILDLDALRPVTAADAIIAAAKAGTAKLPARRSAGEATTVTLAPKNRSRPSAAATPVPVPPSATVEAKDDTYDPQPEAEIDEAALEQVAARASVPPATGEPDAESVSEAESVSDADSVSKAESAPTPAPVPRVERKPRGRDRTATATTWRGGRGRAARKPPSRMRLLIVIGAIVLIAGGAAGIGWAMYAKQDKFLHQADDLLKAALEKPEGIAAGADTAFVRLLIRKDHAAALEAAKLKRGGYEGYKPAYDEARYREALGAAVAKQVAEPDSALLSECAKSLVVSDQTVISDIAVAKKLATRAVELDQEKSWRSLDALAWATFRGGDAKKALLMEEQANELAATSGEGKTVCLDSLSKFKGGGER